MTTPISGSTAVSPTATTDTLAPADPLAVDQFQAAMAPGGVTDAQVEQAITEGIMRQIILDTQKHLERIKETFRS
ncbi:hypothetical protein [Ramlibacter albus]|uniref:Uncharacterized protein n=1 Tax=Ramlibacter albus TaxID=2079448 RepID=A0A923S282_9BURK|nr:hypothetical protein [Ramlibacter albus]MBC5764483.1 hypothetical protein [Ramlibacter albus]